MFKRIILLPLIVFVGGLLAIPAHGEVRPWKIDREHTNFYFRVDHIYATVQGRFTDYRGTVRFDPDNLEDSEMSFEIKVKSVDTGIGKRDRHLRSSDFFNASKYPLITFASRRITRTGADLYTVEGTLTIKDVSSDLAWQFTYEGMRESPFSSDIEVAGMNGQLTLDRLDYNVGDGSYYKMGGVGKDVDILVTIELLRDK